MPRTFEEITSLLGISKPMTFCTQAEVTAYITGTLTSFNGLRSPAAYNIAAIAEEAFTLITGTHDTYVRILGDEHYAEICDRWHRDAGTVPMHFHSTNLLMVHPLLGDEVVTLKARALDEVNGELIPGDEAFVYPISLPAAAGSELVRTMIWKVITELGYLSMTSEVPRQWSYQPRPDFMGRGLCFFLHSSRPGVAEWR